MRQIRAYPRLAHLPVVARCAFILNSAPVSLNRTYGTRAIPKRNGKPGAHTAMMYMSSDAKDRKDGIRGMARLTKPATWPTDLWAPAHVRLSIYAFNTKGDAANEVKLVADALEGVLYVNDNIVSIGEIPVPENDGGTPRVEYLVDLLEVRTHAAARALEMAQLGRRLQTARKGLAKRPGDAILQIEYHEAAAALTACKAALLKGP